MANEARQWRQQDQLTPTAGAAHLEEKALSGKFKFVREHPDYGYGTDDSAGAAAVLCSASAANSRPMLCRRAIDSIRERDFPRLLQPMASTVTERRESSGDGLVYLDHAGATLYGASQLREAMEPLLEGVHGNPHSQGPVSSVTAARIDSARHAVLEHFGASAREWSVVFTSGATAALKTVGEQFPWRPGGTFVHARASHNSVLGIREYARAGGADVESLDLDSDCTRLVEKIIPPDDLHGCRCSCGGVGGGGGLASPSNGSTGCTRGGGELHGAGRKSRRSRWKGASEKDEGSGGYGSGRDLEHPSGSTLAGQRDYVGGAGARGTSSSVDAGGSATDVSSDSSDDEEGVVDCLFAFPAECNATGARADLALAGRVKRGALSFRCCARCCCVHRDRHRTGPLGRRGNGVMSGRRSASDTVPNGVGETGDSSECGDGEPVALTGSKAPPPPPPSPRSRWWVMLDAAKFVGTAPLDLSTVEADFVALSFYKILGYPTGLGALIVRARAARVLRKGYFGGGTVTAALADSPFRQFRPETERRLSDGTEHFLGVLALEAGFRALKAVGGMKAIAAHTSSLARYLHAQLSSLRHGSGEPVVRFFGRWGALESASPKRKGRPSAASFGDAPAPAVDGAVNGRGGVGEVSAARAWPRGGQGPVLTMGFLRPAGGGHVGHAEVEKLAGLENIQLRTGCFCNPGACQTALGLSDRDVMEHLERGHVCWDEHDLIDGRPTGLVRVSLGWMSTWEDAAAFVSFVRKHFVVGGPDCVPSPHREDTSSPPADILVNGIDGSRPRRVLEAIYVYPIKSCAPQRAGTDSSGSGDRGSGERRGQARWPLGPSGLAFDREWAVVDHHDRALRLKQAPNMCKIRPFVDLDARTLTVSAPGMPDLVLPLSWAASDARETTCSDHSAGAAANEARGGDSRCHRHNSHRMEASEALGGGSHCSRKKGSGRGDTTPVIVRVCGNRRTGITCSASASAWFTRFLGVPCSLVRAASVAFDPAARSTNASVGYPLGGDDGGRNTSSVNTGGGTMPESRVDIEGGWGASVAVAAAGPGGPATVTTAATAATAGEFASRAFANEAQYLLISRASVAKVNKMIRESEWTEGKLSRKENGIGSTENAAEQVTTAHFRPNFVVNGVQAHEEDGWRHVEIGGVLRFKVTGPCSRCSMINIDPETGDASGVALKVLAGYRRERANILFGQFLAWDPTSLPPTASDALYSSPEDVSGSGGVRIERGGRGGTGEGDASESSGENVGTGWFAVAAEAKRKIGEDDDGGVDLPPPPTWGGGNDGEERGSKTGLDRGRCRTAAPGVGRAGTVAADGSVGGWEAWVSEGMEVAGQA